MKKLFTLFSGVLATLIATPVIAQLPFDCGQWNAKEFGYGLNPPMNCPVESCWGNIGVYAEFIYFRASEDNTFAYKVAEFATIEEAATPTPEFSTSTYRREKFCPNFKPGYRVGVLYALPCDQWGIDANYTYFYQKNTRNSRVGLFTNSIDPFPVTSADPFVNNGVIIGLPYNLELFSENSTFGTLTTQVGSTWKFRFNQVDVDLTRQYYVGPAVTIRPFVGFRGLFIQQNINSLAVRDFASSTSAAFSYDSIIVQGLKCNSDAYGLHGGTEVTYDLFDGVSIFGNVGIALLWTHFTTEFNRIQTVFAAGTDDLNQILALPLNKESFDVMRFGADLSAGLQWSTLFNCNQNEFFIRAAWEHHIYMSQNAFKTFVDGERDFEVSSLGGLLDTTGDLALYGFSIGAGFTF